jgi:hypothetical protein
VSDARFVVWLSQRVSSSSAELGELTVEVGEAERLAGSSSAITVGGGFTGLQFGLAELVSWSAALAAAWMRDRDHHGC